MTEVMEFSHRSIKVNINTFNMIKNVMEHMNLVRREMEDIKDRKRTKWKF